MSDEPVTADKKSLIRLAERIRARRTINLFLQQAVSRQLILDAIEVARWAPNHHLTEPWHFYLLGDEAIRKSIELTRVVVTERKGKKIGDFKAKESAARPGWLVVTCKRSEDSELEKEDYASVCCAIQNFNLYVSEAGLASKWATGPITRDPRFFELLHIDIDKEFIVALIWYGYPKITPTQRRKDVSEIVTETK